MVSGWEKQIVGIVFVCCIRSPHLLFSPWNILHMKYFTVVDTSGAISINRQNMVILHIILVTVVIRDHIVIQVMRGININLAFKYMSRRIRSINMSYERFIGLHWLCQVISSYKVNRLQS
ncbi:hypothetical protein D3C75_746120 [compost metagenome]